MPRSQALAAIENLSGQLTGYSQSLGPFLGGQRASYEKSCTNEVLIECVCLFELPRHFIIRENLS